MPGPQPNLQQLMQQAQKMQRQMMQAQEELAQAEVEGHAGGGLVKATLSGTGEVRSISIDPSAVDPDDVETLQDLIVAALRDAGEAANRLAAEKMGPLQAGLGGGMGGGMGGGGMGGLGLPGF